VEIPSGLKVKIGIVVPTLGTREDYLVEALESISKSGNCHVCLVAPEGAINLGDGLHNMIDQIVKDPGLGLPHAINMAIRALPPNIEYVNWLGDDDALVQESMVFCQEALEADESLGFVFGGCDYVNGSGTLLGTNPSAWWAKHLIRFGPDLIPQPGALVRRSTFEAIGGLNEQYKLAFDLDMFIRLTKVSNGKHLNRTLARFRWHSESLSVSQRAIGVAEASHIRVGHLPRPLRWLSPIWEIPVRWATLRAGHSVSNSDRRKQFR
jgi:hypothetical protein